jgi:hypothetical protein
LATTSQIIDTGQSLGKNLKIQDGKVVPVEQPSSISADLSVNPAQPLQHDLVSETKTMATGHTQEPKTYFATPGEVVELHSDTAGQTYLTVRGNSLLISLFVGVVVLVYAFLILKVLSSTRTKKAKSVEVIVEETVEDTPVRKIRRLTL